MKRFLNILGIMLALSIVATSCEKAPFLTLSTPKTINFTDQGGAQSITFTANRDWSVSSSDSWCKVSPSSGNKADGNITITLTCEPNTTYDPRSATLTVRVEELSETITVTQDTNLGLLVSPTSYDLTNAAQSIEVEVRANVKYSVEIDAACKDWITQTGTKALSTEKITFSIAANESYDNREGKITIKQTDGNLSETIVVKQSQTNGLFITTPEYDLSNEDHTLSVEVKANVSFQVTPQVDWIKYVETKALTSSTIVLSIEANKTYDDRTGTVLVKQSNGDLSGTITINQKQTDGLFVTPTDVDVDNAEHTVELEVKNNVSYDVVIPDDAKEWISIKSNTATKALIDNKIVLAIAQNSSYDNRDASITIKQTDGPLAETVRIKQAQTDGLIVGKTEYEIGRDGETITIELQTNIEYDVIIPEEAKEWIMRVDSAPTKGLVDESIYLQVAENPTYYKRESSVVIKKKGADLQQSVLIKQAQTDTLFISDDSKEYKVSSQGGEIIVNVFHNIDFEIDATSVPEWITISKSVVNTYNSKLSLKVNQNPKYVGRDANVIIAGGTLFDVISISQHQVDIVSTSITEFAASWQESELTVVIQSNVDYTPSLPEWIVEKSKESEKDGDLIVETIVYTILENLDEAREAFIQYSWQNEGIDTVSSIKVAQSYCIIELDEAGSLINVLSPAQISRITILKIVGEVNGTDIVCIQRMSNIKALDMGDAKIVPGGVPFAYDYCTETDVIGFGMFVRMNFEQFVFPKDLKSIGVDAFFECKNLRAAKIPKSVVSIDNDAFIYCFEMTELELQEGLKRIEMFAFSQCPKLSVLTIPSSVEYIGDYAFSNDTGVKEVHVKAFPNNIKIQTNAFNGLYDTAILYIPKGTMNDYYLTDLGKFKTIIEE